MSSQRTLPTLQFESLLSNELQWVQGASGDHARVHAPVSGSPALDRIPCDVNGCGTDIDKDQRGEDRPIGYGCDIGAYEVTDVVDLGLTVSGQWTRSSS